MKKAKKMHKKEMPMMKEHHMGHHKGHMHMMKKMIHMMEMMKKMMHGKGKHHAKK